MFKTFMNFSTFFIIAYRNRLILFDLTNEPKDFCVDQILVNEQVINMSLVKNPSEETYRVLITTKDNELLIFDQKLNRQKHSLFDQERIQLIKNDKYCLKVVFYLTKTLKTRKKPVFYIRKGSNVFKNYEQKQENEGEAVFKLYAVAGDGKPQLLLSSEEGAKLNEKTDFVVFTQNREFEDEMGRQQTNEVKLMIDSEE